MRTRVVKHIAQEARDEVLAAMAEAKNMADNYPELANRTKPGTGLDLAVLRETLVKADKLLKLLA